MTAELALCAVIAGSLGLCMLLLRMRAPLGADEGYLWYGVQQLLHRRMPHRDFKSYEPGRYLWSAVLLGTFGPGLLPLRVATHLFFSVALTLALLVLREFQISWLAAVLVAVALASWAHPQHKQFEHGWLLLAWAAIAHALLLGSPKALALAGAATGLALFFGFNLFLYSGAALLASLGIAWFTGAGGLQLPQLQALLAGGLLGLLPFALMLCSRGFAMRFYRRRIGSVLERGSANLPLPLPWPWRSVPAQLRDMGNRRRAFQWIFVLMIVLPASVLVMLAWAPENFGRVAPGLLAAAALALCASHHAASRADAPHIAQSIGPLILLLVLLCAELAPVAGAALVAVLSAWLTWPLWARVRSAVAAGETRMIGELAIHMPPAQASLFDRAEALCRDHASKRSGLFVAPAYPALYAALFRDSPVYDTFCLYPAQASQQQEMIDAMRANSVFSALVSNEPFDGREELRFSRTHPLIWTYLTSSYRRELAPELGSDVFVFTAPRAAVC